LQTQAHFEPDHTVLDGKGKRPRAEETQHKGDREKEGNHGLRGEGVNQPEKRPKQIDGKNAQGRQEGRHEFYVVLEVLRLFHRFISGTGWSRDAGLYQMAA
jgi:hypothetical protein